MWHWCTRISPAAFHKTALWAQAYANQPSLELWRVRADMYWCYKIAFGLVDIQPDNFFLLIPVTVTCGHKYKLFKRGCNACVRANFFAERVINYWNSLHDNVNFSSFYSFKRSLIWLTLDFNYIFTLMWATVSALLCLAVRFYCYFIHVYFLLILWTNKRIRI